MSLGCCVHAQATLALPKVAPVGICAWTLLLWGSPPTWPLANSWSEAAHPAPSKAIGSSSEEVIRKQQSLTKCRTPCPLPRSIFASFAKMSSFTVYIYQEVIASATEPRWPGLWEMGLGALGPSCSTVTIVQCVWAVMVTRPFHGAPWRRM